MRDFKKLKRHDLTLFCYRQTKNKANKIMPLEEFIIWVYCWTDENVNKVLENTKLRSRGFQPELISGIMDYLWRAIDQDGDVTWSTKFTHPS
jgi:hypothetical protein